VFFFCPKFFPRNSNRKKTGSLKLEVSTLTKIKENKEEHFNFQLNFVFLFFSTGDCPTKSVAHLVANNKLSQKLITKQRKKRPTLFVFLHLLPTNSPDFPLKLDRRKFRIKLVCFT